MLYVLNEERNITMNKDFQDTQPQCITRYPVIIIMVKFINKKLMYNVSHVHVHINHVTDQFPFISGSSICDKHLNRIQFRGVDSKL